MDAIEKAQKRKNKREKRARNQQYHTLRKFRKARDIASKHLIKEYPTMKLLIQVRNNEALEWIGSKSTDELAISIYNWAKKYTE